MAQKSHFKAVETNTYIKRNTFPQLPFAELENPEYMKTHLGGKLLLGGLWGYLRKPSKTSLSLSRRLFGIEKVGEKSARNKMTDSNFFSFFL